MTRLGVCLSLAGARSVHRHVRGHPSRRPLRLGDAPSWAAGASSCCCCCSGLRPAKPRREPGSAPGPAAVADGTAALPGRTSPRATKEPPGASRQCCGILLPRALLPARLLAWARRPREPEPPASSSATGAYPLGWELGCGQSAAGCTEPACAPVCCRPVSRARPAPGSLASRAQQQPLRGHRQRGGPEAGELRDSPLAAHSGRR